MYPRRITSFRHFRAVFGTLLILKELVLFGGFEGQKEHSKNRVLEHPISIVSELVGLPKRTKQLKYAILGRLCSNGGTEAMGSRSFCTVPLV